MIIYGIYAGLSALSPFFGNRKWYALAFAAFLILFIGFRFETGFDWPVYKNLFSDLRAGNSAAGAYCYANAYHQELLFVMFLGGMAHLFSQYEMAQALNSLVFLSSLFFLGRSLKLPNVTFFVAIALSYIVFTVGFSTVRQSLAIAAFNFAIVFHLNRRNGAAVGLLVVCALFQYTSILYIFSFLITVFTYRRFKSPVVDALIFGTLSAGALVVGFVFLRSGMTFGSVRVAYYVSAISAQGVTKWDVVFTIVLVGIASHVLISLFFKERSENEVFASRMMLVLSAISIAAIIVPIIRERASYQMWIMYAVVLASQITILRRLAICTAFAFSAYYAYAVPFRYPSSLMFVPYQNFLLAKLTATDYPSRQYDTFTHEYLTKMAPTGAGAATATAAHQMPDGPLSSQPGSAPTMPDARKRCSKI